MHRYIGMSMRMLLVAAAVGAGTMYLLDPRAGRRRRALIRDQFVRGGRRVREEIDVEMRDTANRTRGLVARVRGYFERRPVDDRIIEQRVRSGLGRYTAHPGAIRISVRDGVVRLEGEVLAVEADRVRRIARRVRGSRHLDDRLEVHETADVPSLQGEGRQPARFRMVPATRLALGTTIGAVAIIALRPRAEAPRSRFAF